MNIEILSGAHRNYLLSRGLKTGYLDGCYIKYTRNTFRARKKSLLKNNTIDQVVENLRKEFLPAEMKDEEILNYASMNSRKLVRKFNRRVKYRNIKDSISNIPVNPRKLALGALILGAVSLVAITGYKVVRALEQIAASETQEQNNP